MRILHTADWHVGKKLGRIDRLQEAERALDEVVEIARDQKVDCAIVAGDLFDRALAAYASLGLVLDALGRLADAAGRVVAIPGNHDSADLFGVLAPYLEGSGVHLVHRPLPADRGGVIRVPTRDGAASAQVACFPFLHEAHLVDFMEDVEEWHKSYAERVRKLCRHYADWMQSHTDRNTIDVLVGHFMVHGAVPSGSERQLHIGEAYMAREDAIPNVHYAALGHIHRNQHAPGTDVPAWYAGSLLQLDFGEAGQDKFVIVADVTPEGRAKIEKIPVTCGRQLIRVRDTIDGIRKRLDEFGDAILDVAIITDGPAPGLSDEVRDLLPNALYVRADYEREEAIVSERADLGLGELYEEYVRVRYGAAPSDELMKAFRELCDEVGAHL